MEEETRFAEPSTIATGVTTWIVIEFVALLALLSVATAESA
jgi:hypothetical protein